MAKTALYWFTHDLRIEDNPVLVKAANQTDEMACVFIIDPAWFTTNNYQSSAIGQHRITFLRESLIDLNHKLQALNHELYIFYGHPEKTLTRILESGTIDEVLRCGHPDYELNQIWKKLANTFETIDFIQHSSQTLFDISELPFSIRQLPATFSSFRKMVEDKIVSPTLKTPDYLPPQHRLTGSQTNWIERLKSSSSTRFIGGSSQGQAQLKSYFNHARADHYFEVRNSLDGWTNSTKLSPWLANGCISARQTLESLKHYESTVVKNKSTYWIYFELLWREYFQWYAYKIGKQLFNFSGINDRSPLTCFYPERFKKWSSGNTPYPIVNACMNELNQTGYISNRARQIVASCLVNELQLDWRFGAAYFQQQLIDYDVACNWGNWQYIAGVGADPRQGRHFNLDKQTRQFDCDFRYIKKWTQNQDLYALDSVDAADWPIN